MKTMTKTNTALELALTDIKGARVSELLLGVNLELVPGNAESMTSNRIRNGKFSGPPDPQTGVAPEWQPFGLNMGGMHARAVEGMFMSPSQSQLLHNYSQPYGAGLVQTGVAIRKGETLELRIWAKARHRPVKVKIALRSQASRDEEGYANVEFLIDSAYWKCFRAEFPIAQTDEEAVFFLFLLETGVVLFDQIVLEPVNSNGVDPDVEEAILRLNPSAIRFPGGCISTNHHWRFGTGPRELRPALADPVFKLRTVYDYGTDEYLALCRTMGSTPHITVNIGSGTPRDAADWATYCHAWYVARGEEPPLAYFQMGNELYGSWETSHMTASMYVEALREFVPGVRAGYPNCRIIALAEPESSGVAGEAPTKFREAVLSEAQGLYDVLAINRYKGQWYDDPAEQLGNAIDSVRKIESEMKLLADDCRAAGWKPRIALTEWNYWLHAAHWDGKGFYEPDDALHGIFYSGVIHALMRMGEEVEVASYYHMLNAMGLIVQEKGRVRETALGTLHRLYRGVVPGTLCSLKGSGLDTEALDCVAISHGETLSVFLTHRATGGSLTVKLGQAFGTVSACQTLAAKELTAAMKSHPNQIENGEITVPPLSVTRIDFC